MRDTFQDIQHRSLEARHVLILSCSEALAASSVKVAGRDVLATWKILISAGLAPVLYTVYAVLAGVLASRYSSTYKYRLYAPFLTMTALPFFGYSALKFGEAGLDVFK